MNGKRSRGELGGWAVELLLSALALHSPFFHPALAAILCTVLFALRVRERRGAVVVECGTRRPPLVEIDAKRVLILRGTRVDPVSAIVWPSYLLPASSALTRPRCGWLESGSGVGEVAVGEVAVGLGCLFRTRPVSRPPF